ncbi:isocitrate lyase/PEP mutase family protein [Croceicoccus estronivorus]|uniref:isocitrate lyase/PEP mutase family protein n=1 Tax=Croceicoccus estronivorus TaxID=1172626 RepID=UPI0009EF3F1C|nr:isocitrate lyase/phosphoenolpyruvate mutase family protein [Croceicoccus estronivorus]
MTSPGARLRAAMATGMVTAPGACDPFTARLIARAGFDAVYLGGNALGLSLAKGQPIVTLTETAAHTSEIVLATDLPLIVDAGAGFGSPVHVLRTVREIEHAGAAALHIDDQPYPKSPGYHRGDGGLAQVEEMVKRLRAAVQARRDPDLLLIARTDALRVSGPDEAVARARAYAAAGADAIMILDLGPEQACTMQAQLPGIPLVWIGGVVPPVPETLALAKAGFAIALYPFNTIAAIAGAVSTLWETLRDTGRIDQPDALLRHMRTELAEIAGMADYWDLEDDLAGKPRRGSARSDGQ